MHTLAVKIARLLLLLPVPLIVTGVAQAQSNCADILQHGLFATDEMYSFEDSAQARINWVCSQNFSSRQSSEGVAGALDTKVVGLDFSKSESEASNAYASLCSDTSTYAKRLAENWVSNQRADPAIVDAWRTCAAQTLGGTITFRLTPDSTVFFVDFSFRSYRTDGSDQLSIDRLGVDEKVGSTFIPVACRSAGSTLDSFTIANGTTRSLRCARSSGANDVYVAVSSDILMTPGSELLVPGIKPPADPQGFCVEFNSTTGLCKKCELRNLSASNTAYQNILLGSCPRMSKELPIGFKLKAHLVGDPRPDGTCNISAAVGLKYDPQGTAAGGCTVDISQTVAPGRYYTTEDVVDFFVAVKNCDVQSGTCRISPDNELVIYSSDATPPS